MFRIENGGQQPGAALLDRLSGVLRMDTRELFDLAGCTISSDLPELGPYIRMKFKDLPPRSFAEIESFVEFLRSKYGSEADPVNGDDERPDGTPSRGSARRQ